MKDLWVPAIYIANDPLAQLINNKDDMSKHVLGNDFNRKKLFLSPLKASMSHMKWRWETETRTKREDEGKRATLKPECMKTLILSILFHNTFKIIFPLKQSLSKCPYEPRSQPKLTVLQICTTVNLKRLGFPLQPFQLLHPKNLHIVQY